MEMPYKDFDVARRRFLEALCFSNRVPVSVTAKNVQTLSSYSAESCERISSVISDAIDDSAPERRNLPEIMDQLSGVYNFKDLYTEAQISEWERSKEQSSGGGAGVDVDVSVESTTPMASAGVVDFVTHNNANGIS
jgi:hypothetical protein